MEYDVVSNFELAGMVGKVNERLKCGWQLLGGVSCTICEDGDSWSAEYCQAMVLKGPADLNISGSMETGIRGEGINAKQKS